MELIQEELKISFPQAEEFKQQKIQRNYSAYWDAVKKLKAKDYFKYTPSDEHILRESSSCILRKSKRFAIQHPLPDAKECYEMFSIKKFLHRGMMCYHFKPKVPLDENIYVEEYSLAPEISGMIYKLFFDKEKFGDVEHYANFLHGAQTSKFYDSIFTPKRYHFLNTNSTTDFLSIDVSYSSVTNIFMLPPYDTNCRDIPGFRGYLEWWFANFRKLLINGMELVDTLTPLYKAYPYPLLGTEFLINITVVDAVNAIMKLLPDGQNTCLMHYYVSRQTVSYSNQLSVAAFWPEDIATQIRRIEDQALIDYIVYICSSIGIWFGLSFWSSIKLILDRVMPIEKKKKRATKPVKSCHPCGNRFKALFQYFKIVTEEQDRKIDLLKSRI